MIRTYGLYVTCFLEPKTVALWPFVSSDAEKQGKRIMSHSNTGGYRPEMLPGAELLH